MMRIVLATMFLAIGHVAFGYELKATKLRCELTVNPLGLEVIRPRLGWEITEKEGPDSVGNQVAYQIIVSRSRENVEGREKGDLWDSGKVLSERSQFIEYNGKPLKNGERYFWRVRIWNRQGRESKWSEVGYWELAGDLTAGGAKWIGAITKASSGLPEGRNFHSPSMKKPEVAAAWGHVNPLAKRSIMLRKEIDIKTKKLVRATVAVCGLGHYELTLNGKRVGHSVFAPTWSDYDKSVYYNLYDVENLLQPGHNAIGVILGNGMYNVTGDRYRKLWVSFGPPTLFFQLELHYADGSVKRIVSDESWHYSESPITFNCIYGGEDYDARLEQPGWDNVGFSEKAWKPVVIQEQPKGVLRAQLAPPVEEQSRHYAIDKVVKSKPGLQVFDMWQNLSGYPAIRVRGKAGQVVRLLVGELLQKDSTVNQKRSGGPYYLQYTLKGDSVEEWKPRFTYYGFQYIQVEGADFKLGNGDRPVLLDVTSRFIYTGAGNTDTQAHFNCSDTLFLRIHELINSAVKSNWQGVFTDCPHREKLGWLEETYLNGPGLMLGYNQSQFIPKVMQDIADGQRPNGLVPSIVPEYVIFGGDFTDSPEWGVASVVLPWMYYEYYGDASLLQKHYSVMKRYIDYLASRADGYIVSHGLGDWYDYGDHPAGYSKNSPIPLSATAHFYMGASLVGRAAALLGHYADTAVYNGMARHIRDAFNNKFYHSDTKQYAAGSQYANAIPLYLGIVPEADRKTVLANLVADIHNHGGHLTTGDIGNRYLFQTLAENGYNDIMYNMTKSEDVPGYGFQVKYGVTTLTEQWDPRKGNSWNHFMMGQIDEWFYKSLAGINTDMAAPGFKHSIIKPQPVGDMNSAQASTRTIYGLLGAGWEINNEEFYVRVRIPANTTATVILPDGSSHFVTGGHHDFKCKLTDTK